ncbi:hypothetical protein PC116_g11594 [Phytophthora cactorum]|nr:hypothetical protein PC116_g11594 [Phytophthora cactorum]
MKHIGKTGIILRVLQENRQHTYEVQRSTGDIASVSARSVCAQYGSTAADDEQSGDDLTFVQLLGSEEIAIQDMWSMTSLLVTKQ